MLALDDRLAGAHGLTEKANSFPAREVLLEHAAGARQGARVAEVVGRARGSRPAP